MNDITCLPSIYKPAPHSAQCQGVNLTSLALPPSPQAKELPTFKDNDFLNEGQKLQIGDDNKKYFLEKLKRDVEVRSFDRDRSGIDQLQSPVWPRLLL